MTRRHRARSVLVLGSALGVLVSGCGSDRDAAASSAPAERDETLRVVTAGLERALSYDAATLRRDLAEVDDLTDGALRTQLTTLLGDTAADTIRTTRARNAVTVVGVGTLEQSATDPDAPVLLAFVRQTTTSRATTGARSSLAALEVTLRRVGADWKLTDVTPVAPGAVPPEESD